MMRVSNPFPDSRIPEELGSMMAARKTQGLFR